MNEGGSLPAVNCHDKTIIRIELSLSNIEIEFGIINETQTDKIMVSGVQDFSITNFTSNNYVSEILAWPLKDAPIIDSSEFGFFHISAGRFEFSESEKFRNLYLKKDDDAKLIQIINSYGGMISIIGGKLVLLE
jgi:hypothetical protein